MYPRYLLRVASCLCALALLSAAAIAPASAQDAPTASGAIQLSVLGTYETGLIGDLTFDLDGNLWISTDGQPRTSEANDGLFAVPVEGEERGNLQLFLTGVTDCEICGPEFTPDNTSLFVAIQHPGDGDEAGFDTPSTAWPSGF